MVIFGTGVITGGIVVDRVAQRSRQHHAPANKPPGSPGGTRVDFLRKAERDLDLTPQQREQADKVIASSQEHIKKLMEPVNPKIREELQRTRDDFRAILTPEQKARFDDMVKQQQQRSRDQRHSPGHPPEASNFPSSVLGPQKQ
jgi:Spy/CpxP family protein refolding chaperone